MTVRDKSYRPHRKKKLKFGYFLLIVIAIMLLLLAGFVYSQHQNIKAIYGAATSSAGEIKQQQENNEQRTRDILSGLTDMDIRELPEDMRLKLKNGEISEEEALNIILGAENPASSKENNSSESDNVKNDTNSKDVNDSLNTSTSVGRKEEIIAKIYLLRAEYLNKIDALIASGKATISSIPKEEFTLSKKMSVLNMYKSKGSALESDCDSRMEGLLSELRDELENLGESTDVVSDIRTVYNEQKHLKKEELLNTYYPK